MCRRDHEDNKSIISGGREAERAPSQQRALCVIVAPAPGGPVSTPLAPSSPMGYHSRRRHRRGLVRRRDGGRASTTTTFITKFYKRLKYNPRATNIYATKKETKSEWKNSL